MPLSAFSNKNSENQDAIDSTCRLESSNISISRRDSFLSSNFSEYEVKEEPRMMIKRYSTSIAKPIISVEAYDKTIAKTMVNENELKLQKLEKKLKIIGSIWSIGLVSMIIISIVGYTVPNQKTGYQCSTCPTGYTLNLTNMVCSNPCLLTNQKWNGTTCHNASLSYNQQYCSSSEQCSNSLVCNLISNSCNCPTNVSNNYCDCPTRSIGQEYYWNGSICKTANSYGYQCTANYHCKYLTQNTYCNGSICVCPSYKYFDTQQQICVNQLLNNQPCVQASSCRVDLGLICQLSGICSCDSNTQFWNNLICINYYTYNNQMCTNSSQCKSPLVCNSNSVSCNCPIAVQNSYCDCPTPVAIYEYYWDGSTSCSASVPYGWSCSGNFSCQGVTQNTYCYNGVCSCRPLQYFYLIQQLCRNQRLITESCMATGDCRTDYGLRCIAGNCCPYYQYYESTYQNCTNQLMYNQQTCYSDYYCRTDLGLVCNNISTCQCNTTSYWNGINCTNMFSYSNGPCTSSSQCLNGLICRTSGVSCSCPTNISMGYCDCLAPVVGIETFWYNNTCTASFTYGSNCSASYYCQVLTQNTFCNGSKCVCLSTQYFDTIQGKCVNKLLINQTCSLATDCRQDLGLNCVSTICQCNTTSQIWNGSYCIGCLSGWSFYRNSCFRLSSSVAQMSSMNSTVIKNSCYGYSSPRLAILLEIDATVLWFVSAFGNDVSIDAQRNQTKGNAFYSFYTTGYVISSDVSISVYWNCTNPGQCVSIQDLTWFPKFFSTADCNVSKYFLCEIVL